MLNRPNLPQLPRSISNETTNQIENQRNDMIQTSFIDSLFGMSSMLTNIDKSFTKNFETFNKNMMGVSSSILEMNTTLIDSLQVNNAIASSLTTLVGLMNNSLELQQKLKPTEEEKREERRKKTTKTGTGTDLLQRLFGFAGLGGDFDSLTREITSIKDMLKPISIAGKIWLIILGILNLPFAIIGMFDLMFSSIKAFLIGSKEGFMINVKTIGKSIISFIEFIGSVIKFTINHIFDRFMRFFGRMFWKFSDQYRYFYPVMGKTWRGIFAFITSFFKNMVFFSNAMRIFILNLKSSFKKSIISLFEYIQSFFGKIFSVIEYVKTLFINIIKQITKHEFFQIIFRAFHKLYYYFKGFVHNINEIAKKVTDMMTPNMITSVGKIFNQFKSLVVKTIKFLAKMGKIFAWVFALFNSFGKYFYELFTGKTKFSFLGFLEQFKIFGTEFITFVGGELLRFLLSSVPTFIRKVLNVIIDSINYIFGTSIQQFSFKFDLLHWIKQLLNSLIHMVESNMNAFWGSFIGGMMKDTFEMFTGDLEYEKWKLEHQKKQLEKQKQHQAKMKDLENERRRMHSEEYQQKKIAMNLEKIGVAPANINSAISTINAPSYNNTYLNQKPSPWYTESTYNKTLLPQQ